MTWISRYKQNKLISKISVDFNFATSYPWLYVFHSSIDYSFFNCQVLQFMWKLFLFHTKLISAYFGWENVLLREELWIDAKNSIFDHFENTICMKSLSMPLNTKVYQGNINPLRKRRREVQVSFSFSVRRDETERTWQTLRLQHQIIMQPSHIRHHLSDHIIWW